MKMTNYVYKAVIIALFVVGVYDWFTSFMGAVAIFKLTENSPIYLWGFPVAISIGAIALNFITLDIWKETDRFSLMRFVWIAFLMYDFYTSYLGISQMVTGGNLLDWTYTSMFSAVSDLPFESIIVVLVLSFIVVVSPMSAFRIIKRLDSTE